MQTFASVSVLIALVALPAAVAVAQLPGEPKPPELWESPVGQMEYNFKIGAPDERVRSAQERLRDGGYYTGPIDGVLSPRVRRAIWDFQKQHRLTRSGRLDPATVARLEAGSAPSASPASR
jgi:peptidoglycan hydrolase-like protein with peptidoglycan-binding domain